MLALEHSWRNNDALHLAEQAESQPLTRTSAVRCPPRPALFMLLLQLRLVENILVF